MQFPYLEAVLCESLRLTPPGAFGSIRVAREDFEVCGLTVRKGWFLNVRPSASPQLICNFVLKFCIDFRIYLPTRFRKMHIFGYQKLLSSALHSFLQTAQYSFHNNPKYWAEPERFRPERLLTKTGSRAAAFAPFGDGGRQCVGMRFAKAASKVNTRPIHNPPQCITRDQVASWKMDLECPSCLPVIDRAPSLDDVYAYCCRSRSSGFSRDLPWRWSGDRRHCS